jgi:hypothetical protein
MAPPRGATDALADEAPAPPAPAAGGSPSPTRWSAGRVIAVITGSVLAVASLGMLAAGLVLRVADGGLRDPQGYLMSSSTSYASPGYAVTSESVELHSGSTPFDLPRRWLGTVKVEVDSRASDQVFVGLARTTDVNTYLDGVAHSVVTDPTGDNGDPVTTYVNGRAPRLAPRDAGFWEESASGERRQTITWEPRSGDWTLVVMNTAGTSPVSADVAVGAEVPVLADVAVALLISGSLLLVISLAVIAAAVRHASARP